MLRRGSRIGKYRIEGRLADGGFAKVFRAFDTIEGVRVALKIAHEGLVTHEALGDFRAEVRLTAKLDHPNILPIKDASILDGRLVIVHPLGECSLEDRLRRRLAAKSAVHFASQLLAGLAHAHEHKIIHCDIKPHNAILFPGGRLRLSDFGIARFALRTMAGSGSGTLGYMAPEQAMGKPSFRSDVFSAALVIYRMLSGCLPEWPFEWPPPGFDRVRGGVHPELVTLLARCLAVHPKRRLANAVLMHNVFKKIRPRALQRPRKRAATTSGQRESRPDWKQIRWRHFLDEFGRQLEARATCKKCDGPLSEAMQACPWCGQRCGKYRGDTRFPLVCPRCNRGVKLDWNYCAWCHGAGFEASSRPYGDKRYVARCPNPSCGRRELMPFMRYCPWCRRKVTRKWKFPGATSTCAGCGWGIAREYWDFCPWCARKLRR